MAAWLAAEHIAPTPTHPGARGVIDDHLAMLGLERNITARCPHFGLIPAKVSSSLPVLPAGRQYCERYVARLSATLDRPSELVVSAQRPLLVDRYLTDAVEVDVDCLSDGKDTYIAGVMEHIEEAGVHAGDSACSLPPHSLSPEAIAELGRQARELALALGVVGLMNVQFAIKGGVIYVLEVNPRASRTVPFVAKETGVAIAKLAARLMAGACEAVYMYCPFRWVVFRR